MFKDRKDAGEQLAKRLSYLKGISPVIFAIPRGAVPVAYEIAKSLDTPLELVFIKKIGHPENKEYAVGAASLYDYFISPNEEISKDYIETELKSVRKRLREMQDRFLKGRTLVSVKDKIIVLVDDGVATGKTLIHTIQIIRKSNPKKIVIAAPVASEHAIRELSSEADEVITLITPKNLHAIGSFYENFEQLTDDEVESYLNQFQPAA